MYLAIVIILSVAGLVFRKVSGVWRDSGNPQRNSSDSLGRSRLSILDSLGNPT